MIQSNTGMTHPWLRLPFGIACGCLVFGVNTAPAIADQPQPQAPASPTARVKAADNAFQEGRELLKQGKLTEACAKLEESQRLDPATGTLLNLADCYERIGKTASAWRAFQDVAVQAKAAGRADREKEGRERAKRLEPRLSRLEIQKVDPDKPVGFEVKRDGAGVSKIEWGVPVPVDPGRHRLVATAPGMQPWEDTIDLSGAGTNVVVVIPDLLPLMTRLDRRWGLLQRGDLAPE